MTDDTAQRLRERAYTATCEDLIARQQAEIDRLRAENETLKENAKAMHQCLADYMELRADAVTAEDIDWVRDVIRWLLGQEPAKALEMPPPHLQRIAQRTESQ